MKLLFGNTLIFLFLISCHTTFARGDDSYENGINNFRQAKIAMVNIFLNLDRPKTIYCGCDIEFPKRGGYKPDLISCGYKSHGNESRAKRIEAEHIMPAWEFGHAMKCWIDGGRKKCESGDVLFMKMEGDLHNLYPAVGEVNGDRSNFKFTESVHNSNGYGQCEMYIDRKRQRVVPPNRSKGIVARAYLYMSAQYGIKLDAEHINLFNQWNKKFPPSKNECKRNELIKTIQGNDNPFVTNACKR